jgi:hypothetical protein
VDNQQIHPAKGKGKRGNGSRAKKGQNEEIIHGIKGKKPKSGRG